MAPMTCFECGAPSEHQHHVVPRSLGGTRTIPLCGRCHGLIHGIDLAHTGALTARALQDKRERSEFTGGRIPYGYERLTPVSRWIVECPGEQATITLMRELRAARLTLRAIMKTLNERGIRTRTGAPWSLTQVARALSPRA
jgi:hypothetical protein